MEAMGMGNDYDRSDLIRDVGGMDHRRLDAQQPDQDLTG